MQNEANCICNKKNHLTHFSQKNHLTCSCTWPFNGLFTRFPWSTHYFVFNYVDVRFLCKNTHRHEVFFFQHHRPPWEVGGRLLLEACFSFSHCQYSIVLKFLRLLYCCARSIWADTRACTSWQLAIPSSLNLTFLATEHEIRIQLLRQSSKGY